MAIATEHPGLDKQSFASESHPTYRICYIAGREDEYSRTHIVLQTLRENGHAVVPILPPNKSFKHYPGLLLKFLKTHRECDLIVVGFYGHLLMPFVWLLARKPILFDALVSTYFVMRDRLDLKGFSLKAKIFFLLDKMVMAMADKIVMETNDHIIERHEEFGTPRERFTRIFLPADDNVLQPRQYSRTDGAFLVHFHGEFARFHGVKYIVEAARLLADENVRFQIIGTGQDHAECVALAHKYGLTNCNFIDRVPYAKLAHYMAKADVCLGIFGDTKRTLHELTNKVIEAMAMGRPIITTDNAPVRELLHHEESAFLIPPADPQALAKAIRTLKNNPSHCQQLGKNAYAVYCDKCSQKVFSQAFNQEVLKLVSSKINRKSP